MYGAQWPLRKSCRHPPPGLAFGEPDDRLQRVIQYAAAFPLEHERCGVLDRPVKPGGDDCLWRPASDSPHPEERVFARFEG